MTKRKLRLTKEVKAKLLGFAVVTGSVEFSPEIKDLDEEFIPVFTVRNINNKEYNKIKALYSGKSADEAKSEEVMLDIVRKCVIGWDKLIDISTEDFVEFKAEASGGVDKDLFEIIPLGVKLQIFSFIMSITGLNS